MGLHQAEEVPQQDRRDTGCASGPRHWTQPNWHVSSAICGVQTSFVVRAFWAGASFVHDCDVFVSSASCGVQTCIGVRAFSGVAFCFSRSSKPWNMTSRAKPLRMLLRTFPQIFAELKFTDFANFRKFSQNSKFRNFIWRPNNFNYRNFGSYSRLFLLDGAHFVDLGESFPTSIYALKSASMNCRNFCDYSMF